MKFKTPLLVLALAAAFTAFASATPAPAAAMLDAMKISAASNSLASDIWFAHSEALRRNGRVVLCKSVDGVSCVNAGGWSLGWIVFDDANADGIRNDREELMIRVPALSRTLRLAGSMDSLRAISFGPTGGVTFAGTPGGVVSLTICGSDSQHAQARRLTLLASRSLELRNELADGCSA